ncbi:MAG: MBL fold metallo-hydrolase [Actinomycetes bacterium]
MRLTVVGCSGSLPGPRSPASSYLVEAEDDGGRTWRVVLDLGSGALGPLQRHTRLTDLDAVLLSHLHPDHCMDLCGLYVALRYDPRGASKRRLPVHGPTSTADRMARAYDLSPDPGMTEEFDFVAWREGEEVRIGPFAVTARRVVHPVEAYGMRLEAPGEQGGRKILAYTGDTDSCDALEELSAGADLLLAEAAFQEGRDSQRGIHLTGRRAGELASTAGVGEVVLTHLPPWNDPEVSLAEARSAYAGPITLAEQDAVHVL